MKRIVVKIGSRVLTTSEGFLNENRVASLVENIARIKREKEIEVVLVTSGAVSTGRSMINLDNFRVDLCGVKYDKKILVEQMLASIGQAKLTYFYQQEFAKYGFIAAQLLPTREDFVNRDDYLSLKAVTENLLKLGVVPTYNENDVLSPADLEFSDNDQQACVVAAMIVADLLIILTDVDGVFDGPPDDPNSKVIAEISDASGYLEKVDENATRGKGGMKSKLLNADLATSLGIPMRIASGFENDVICRIVEDENIGTFFPAKSKKASGLKNWLATAASSGEGKIIVSNYLADILRKKQTASVLFAGIEKIEGNFNAKDVVEVCDDEGVLLGRGLVKFSAKELAEKVEQFKSKTPGEKEQCKTTAELIAVHYDYFVFSQ